MPKCPRANMAIGPHRTHATPLMHSASDNYQSLWKIAFVELRSTMKHNLQDTVSLLTRTPAALDALLRDLPETWTFRNEGKDTWSAFEVVGHLIHGERTDWMPRARMILEFADTRTLEPFDRWAQLRESEGKSLGQLLDEF